MPLLVTPPFDPRLIPDHFELNRDLSWLKSAAYFWPLHPLRRFEELIGQTPMGIWPGNHVNGQTGLTGGLVPGVDGSCGMYNGAIVSTGSPHPAIWSQAFSVAVWLKADRWPTAGEGSAGFFGNQSLYSYDGQGMKCYLTSSGAISVTTHSSPYGEVTSAAGAVPIGRWFHLAWTYQTIWYGSNQTRIYCDGKEVFYKGDGVEGGLGAIANPFYIGYGGSAAYGPLGPYAAQAQIRGLCTTGGSGVLWTAAEIEQQYRDPYAAYIPYTPRRYFYPPAGFFDPTHVPDTYAPNNDLGWVQKATHIWAVHPSHVLQADKGGLTLQLVTTGAGVPPSALASPENTMEFHGGAETNASWYQTIGSFIWGDNPTTAGNQTPPMIGAMSCWVDFYTFVQFMGVIGGHNSSGSDANLSAQITAHVNGLMFGNVNGLSFGPTGTANTWYHLAITNDASFRRLYVNGAKVAEAAQTSIAGADLKFDIGTNVYGSTGQRFALNGRLRLVAVVQGATWTDAEILEQYQRPYGYYNPPPPTLPVTFPRLTNAAALRPITIKGTKAHVQFGRLAGYAGIRPAVIKPEQALQFFRLAGYAGLRTLQVRAYPKIAFARLPGLAFLRPPKIVKQPLLEFPRMAGTADLRALDIRTFRGLWHEELAGLYANQIERERRVLLGVDSSLELYTQHGQTTDLRKTLTRDFSVYHVSTLAGPEEWFCDLLEEKNPWDVIREITEIRVKTHGQGIVYKVIALERPVEKGHCYRMRLQAINDPRV